MQIVKKCSKCEKILNIEFFRQDNQGRNNNFKEYYRPECKDCERKLNEQLRLARSKAPKKPNNCECCGRVEKLLVDHDHKTGNFRGWICKRCNLGIGRLGDDLNGVINAVNYLIKTKML